MFNIRVHQETVARSFVAAHNSIAELVEMLGEFVHPDNMPKGIPMSPRKVVYKAIEIGLIGDSEGFKMLREARY